MRSPSRPKCGPRFRDYLDYIMQAARLGFDGVAFTEHAQTTYDMTANPSLIGSAIGYATETEGLDVAVYPVGRSLGKARGAGPRRRRNYAMIDCISGGRLMAGFPVGLMFDAAINNGVPPIEVRRRYEENMRLVLRAWSDPEPFAVERPLQPSSPRSISGRARCRRRCRCGSPGSATRRRLRLALENNFGFNYFGWFGSELTAGRVFARFREVADAAGIPANPNRLAFMASVCVGETDEEAERVYGPHLEFFFNKGPGATSLGKLAIPGGISLPGIRFLLEDQAGDFGFAHEMRHADIGAHPGGRRGRRGIARDGGRAAGRHRPRLRRRQSWW